MSLERRLRRIEHEAAKVAKGGTGAETAAIIREALKHPVYLEWLESRAMAEDQTQPQQEDVDHVV